MPRADTCSRGQDPRGTKRENGSGVQPSLPTANMTTVTAPFGHDAVLFLALFVSVGAWLEILCGSEASIGTQNRLWASTMTF